MFVLRLLIVSLCSCWMTASLADQRPNILIAISDDQSYPHCSAYGDAVVRTPGFDRVAKAGVLFRSAFTPAPGCSPMRAAFLTGREIWQIREAGTHASLFPTDLPVFTVQLADRGYHVGMTGKGWSPGSTEGWPQNPAGKAYQTRTVDSPKDIRRTDYAGNFDDFLSERQAGQPFCFWYGGSEPHRSYDAGIGERSGLDLSKIDVPEFLPDSDVVRNDLADYYFEIEWFDKHLQKMLDRLEQIGELDNTLVIVTSDNGMPFPRAKANLYEYGIHMPLAIAWPSKIDGGQDTDELVSLVDVTRTIFDAADVKPQQPDQLAGRSLLSRYRKESDKTLPPRDAVFSGRERHSSSRFNSLGYPCRCIRTSSHLYIRNFKPERWPAGAPQSFAQVVYDSNRHPLEYRLGKLDSGYYDIDSGPTLQWMVANRQQPDVGRLLAAAVNLRPAEELYDIRVDPACMKNLAEDSAAQSIREDLSQRLRDYLIKTGDLRQTDPEAAEIWETYPRFSSLRWFPTPEWAQKHPDQVPSQPWLEERRPKP